VKTSKHLHTGQSTRLTQHDKITTKKTKETKDEEKPGREMETAREKSSRFFGE
jgi:hypothetical protein